MEITLSNYETTASRIRKLDAAAKELAESGGPELEAASAAIHAALQHTCDLFARSLAQFAHDATVVLSTHERTVKKYHIDNIYEALGRYQYPADLASGAAPLLTLRYDVESIAEAMAPPAPPEAEPAEAVYADARARGLSEYEARELAWPGEPADAGDAEMTEFAREQAPDAEVNNGIDPGLIRA